MPADCRLIVRKETSRGKEAVCFSLFSIVSKEMDDEDCQRRRGECLDEMSDLEKQFHKLKEK